MTKYLKYLNVFWSADENEFIIEGIIEKCCQFYL